MTVSVFSSFLSDDKQPARVIGLSRAPLHAVIGRPDTLVAEKFVGKTAMPFDLVLLCPMKSRQSATEPCEVRTCSAWSDGAFSLEPVGQGALLSDLVVTSASGAKHANSIMHCRSKFFTGYPFRSDFIRLIILIPALLDSLKIIPSMVFPSTIL